MKCEKCRHIIVDSEHYVELENGTILDETCFFDLALEEFRAKNIQYREN